MRSSEAPDRVKTTFFLPAELHQRLRIRAAEERTSMADVLTRVLEQALERADDGPSSREQKR